MTKRQTLSLPLLSNHNYTKLSKKMETVKNTIKEIQKVQNFNDFKFVVLGTGFEQRTYKEAIDLIEKMEDLYSVNVEVYHKTQSIWLRVSRLQENEIGKDLRLVKIARNISSFDTMYPYIEQLSKVKWWANLETKLYKILAELNSKDLSIVKELSDDSKFNYFAKNIDSQISKVA